MVRGRLLQVNGVGSPATSWELNLIRELPCEEFTGCLNSQVFIPALNRKVGTDTNFSGNQTSGLVPEFR